MVGIYSFLFCPVLILWHPAAYNTRWTDDATPDAAPAAADAAAGLAGAAASVCRKHHRMEKAEWKSEKKQRTTCC